MSGARETIANSICSSRVVSAKILNNSPRGSNATYDAERISAVTFARARARRLRCITRTVAVATSFGKFFPYVGPEVTARLFSIV